MGVFVIHNIKATSGPDILNEERFHIVNDRLGELASQREKMLNELINDIGIENFESSNFDVSRLEPINEVERIMGALMHEFERLIKAINPDIIEQEENI
jgi:hypothetical protein